MGIVLIGQTTSGTTSDFIFAGHSYGKKFTASATGTAVTVSCQWKVANASITGVKLAIYTDDAVNGRPGTKLGETSTVSPNPTGTGLFTGTLTTQVSINSGTAYWLAFTGTGEQIDWQGTTDTTGLDQATALPDPWGAGSGGTQAVPVLYAEAADSTVTGDSSYFHELVGPAAGAFGGAHAFMEDIYIQPTTAQVFQQVLSATINMTASLQNQVNKGLTATINLTPSLQKQVNKGLTATINMTASVVKTVLKPLTVTINLTAAVIKQINKPLTANITLTPSLTKVVNKPLTATINLTASLQKQVNKTLSATINMTASVTALKVILKVLTATINMTASVTKQVNKPLTANLTLTSSLQKQVNKTLSAGINLTASVQKQVNKTLTAVINMTATQQALKVVVLVLTATLNMTAAVQKTIQKPLTAQITLTPTATKLITKTLTAGINLTASLSAVFKAAGGAVVQRVYPVIVGRFFRR